VDPITISHRSVESNIPTYHGASSATKKVVEHFAKRPSDLWSSPSFLQGLGIASWNDEIENRTSHAGEYIT